MMAPYKKQKKTTENQRTNYARMIVRHHKIATKKQEEIDASELSIIMMISKCACVLYSDKLEYVLAI